ncbi:MAG: preprotein translocase subunit SecE [Proteobacteria bacterium]|nr:preprotein translocase subunit SecE [Pseudomonadota bacterium]
MNAKAEQVGGNSAADIAKLALALIVLAAGIFAYYWFNGQPTWQRLLMLIGGLVACCAIGYPTHSGRQLKEFLSESVFEMRKVVWPTRQETIQTTIVIMVVVVILALLLGLIDLILKWVILDHLLSIGK